MHALKPIFAESALELPHPVQEPSVDDVLAEIRSFIAVDGERSSAERASAEPQVLGDPDARPLPGSDQLRKLLEAGKETSAPTAETPVWPRPTTEPIASAAAEAAARACFDAFSTCVAVQSAGAIESLTRQMLRPILTNWLDDHLPKIVERLVITEIQRIARGSR